MDLVLANNQGELSPLEYGMHVLKYVELSEGGRGKKGGLSEYARVMGKSQGNLSSYKQAAEITQKLISHEIGLSVDKLLDKARHLAAIHKAPPHYWQQLTELLIENEWSVKQTEAIVDAVNKMVGLQCPDWLAEIVKFDRAVIAAIKGDDRNSFCLYSRLQNARYRNTPRAFYRAF